MPRTVHAPRGPRQPIRNMLQELEASERNRTISWIHFGDLHLSVPDEQNPRNFLALIEEANRHTGVGIHFALLPGDSADDGEEDEYQLVKEAKCFSHVRAWRGNSQRRS